MRWSELVLALGAVPRTVPVPGLADHGLSFKSLADAINLRNHVLRQLEAADAEQDEAARRAHLSFVFVGAGYAGVEALAELSDLVDDALRYYPRLRDTPRRWALVDAAPKILPEIPSRLGEYAARELARARRRDLRRHDARVDLDDEAVPRERRRAFRPARSCGRPACAANPLLREIGVPLDDRGRVEVGRAPARRGPRRRLGARRLRARCRTRAAPVPDPPTCQHALRQARRLAKNIAGTPEPYGYRMLGQVATLGRYKGIADVLGLRLRGFPGWFVTRSYHLYQLPLTQRRLRVVVDWTVALLFRRDVVELGMLGQPERLDQ